MTEPAAIVFQCLQTNVSVRLLHKATFRVHVQYVKRFRVMYSLQALNKVCSNGSCESTLTRRNGRAIMTEPLSNPPLRPYDYFCFWEITTNPMHKTNPHSPFGLIQFVSVLIKF